MTMKVTIQRALTVAIVPSVLLQIHAWTSIPMPRWDTRPASFLAALRSRSEKAKSVAYPAPQNEDDFPEPPDHIVKELRHGDMAYMEPWDYRGLGTYIANHNPKSHKMEMIHAGSDVYRYSGYCSIPIEVTSEIEDPVEFYKDVTSKDLDGGVSFIEMHPMSHSSVLSEKQRIEFDEYRATIWYDTEEDIYIIYPESE